MADIEFIDGLSAKAPNANAPGYVRAKLSIKREALIAFLQQRSEEWINAEVKESQGGKWYVAIDAWKPNSEQSGQREQRQERQQSRPADSSYGDAATGGFQDDEIPFAPIPRRQLW